MWTARDNKAGASTQDNVGLVKYCIALAYEVGLVKSYTALCIRTQGHMQVMLQLR
jgi:hypothetical protein